MPRKISDPAPTPSAMVRPSSYDGYPRTAQQEIDLNQAVWQALGSNENGRRVMAYLESMTLDAVLDPSLPNYAHLLPFQEGMRFVVAVLRRRLNGNPNDMTRK